MVQELVKFKNYIKMRKISIILLIAIALLVSCKVKEVPRTYQEYPPINTATYIDHYRVSYVHVLNIKNDAVIFESDVQYLCAHNKNSHAYLFANVSKTQVFLNIPELETTRGVDGDGDVFIKKKYGAIDEEGILCFVYVATYPEFPNLKIINIVYNDISMLFLMSKISK